MRTVKIYCPPGKAPPIPAFFDTLDPKLRRKLKLQLLRLTQISTADLRKDRTIAKKKAPRKMWSKKAYELSVP